MKDLVIIPARIGSKGIKKKNIKLLNGVPLINYTIREAKKIFPIKDIIVSTDSDEIKKIAEKEKLFVPFLRPKELASDYASSYDVILHVLNNIKDIENEYDKVVLLQPTSPLRTANHIKDALKLYNNNLDMVVSVSHSKSNPYFNLYEENEHGFLFQSKSGNFSQRQKCPKVWEYNGAIYIINIESLRRSWFNKFTKIKKFVMDERSSIDIDTMKDWIIAEYYLINS